MTTETLTPHVHAVVLRAIAEGLRVQYNTNVGVNSGWIDMPPASEFNPITRPDWSWRVASGGPAVILVEGIAVPAPMLTDPEEGQEVFLVSFGGVDSQDWVGSREQRTYLENGALHLIRSHAQMHLQALAVINNQKPQQ